MDWIGITAIIAAGGLLITIGGVVFAFGQSAAQLKALEKKVDGLEGSGTRLTMLESRVQEDRDKNSEQHKDFYGMRDTVMNISSRFDSIEKRLDKLEDGLLQILQRLPERRREAD